MDAVHPADLQVVSAWADSIDGDVIDAGCGPAHWTSVLMQRGLELRRHLQDKAEDGACSKAPWAARIAVSVHAEGEPCRSHRDRSKSTHPG